MPVSCCAVKCTNHFKTESGIGFYSLLVNEDKRNTWIQAVSRDKWPLKPSNRLYGVHFIKGRLSKDTNDRDFIPTISKMRRVWVPAVNSIQAIRRAKEWNRGRKTTVHLQLMTIWLAVLEKNSQQGMKDPRMHLVSQILCCCHWMKDTFTRIRNCQQK